MSIFHAYDVRGIYPSEINEDEVYRIARAYVKVVKPRRVVLARDGRPSGEPLSRAVSEGFRDAGADVISIGPVPTDLFYFAVSTLDVDGGVAVTASHNPREWNGLKLAGSKGVPISIDYLLAEIERETEALPLGERLRSGTLGTERFEDVMPAYFEFLGKFLVHEVRPLTVALDANFGLQGKVFESLVRHYKLPLRTVGVNTDPDGTFPKGPPNPLLPDRRDEIVALVERRKADIGIAWDGDGDRCFFVDERGIFQEGYFTTAVLAGEMLRGRPGEKIVIDPRLVWATTEAIRAHGGEAVVSHPGAARMAKKLEDVGGIFGGETSSHFLFRDFFWRDSGLIPALIMLQMMSRDRRPLSSYYLPFEKKYFISGELNYKVADREGIVKKVEARYSDGTVERSDGLSVEYKDWRFNFRASNTEPLIRLNIEARRRELIEEKKHELEEIIAKN